MGRATMVCLIALLGLVVAGFCDVAKYTERAGRRDTHVSLAAKKYTPRHRNVRDTRPAARVRGSARRDDDEYQCEEVLYSYQQCGEDVEWSDVCCPDGYECVSSGEGSKYMQCRPYEKSDDEYEVDWWRQCGGTSPPGDLEGVYPVDGEYPDYYCKSGSTCERVDEAYWQCKPYESYDRTKGTGARRDTYRKDARSGLTTSRRDSHLGTTRRKDTRAGAARKDTRSVAARKDTHATVGTGKDSHSLTARKDTHSTTARRQDSHFTVGSRKDVHFAGSGKDTRFGLVGRKDTRFGLVGRKDTFIRGIVKDTHSAARRDDDEECEHTLYEYAQCGEYEVWSDVCCPDGWECLTTGEGSNYMQCRPFEKSDDEYEVDWWRQCGGTSPPGDLQGVYPVDGEYPDYYCKYGSKCERVEAAYWQCKPY